MSTKLEPGMLVLDPGEGENPRPMIWTVISARTVIAHYGDCSARATLRASGLPKGWRIVNNRPLAKHIFESFGSTGSVAER